MKKLITAATIFLASVSYSQADQIDLVKGATLTTCPLKSIGELLGSQNFNGKWEVWQAANGAEVVEFNGTISQDLHDRFKAYIKEEITSQNRYSYYRLAQKYLTDAEYGAAMNSKGGYSNVTQAEREMLVIDAWLDKKMWVVGSESKFQFIMQGETFQLGITKNATWDSKPSYVFKTLCDVTP